MLGRDDEFWCQFQRVARLPLRGARVSSARPTPRGARRCASSEKLLGDKARAGERKEFLYISGAMRHFLKDDPAALKAFREAMPLEVREQRPRQGERTGTTTSSSPTCCASTSRRSSAPRPEGEAEGRLTRRARGRLFGPAALRRRRPRRCSCCPRTSSPRRTIFLRRFVRFCYSRAGSWFEIRVAFDGV